MQDKLIGRRDYIKRISIFNPRYQKYFQNVKHVINTLSIHNGGRCDSDYWLCFSTMIDVTIIQIKVQKWDFFSLSLCLTMVWAALETELSAVKYPPLVLLFSTVMISIHSGSWQEYIDMNWQHCSSKTRTGDILQKGYEIL